MNHDKFIDRIDQTILSTEYLMKEIDPEYIPDKESVKLALSRGKCNILKAIEDNLITEKEAAKIMVDNKWSFYDAYKNMNLDIPILEEKDEKTFQLYCGLDDNILDPEVDEKIETREEAMFVLDMGKMIENRYLQFSDRNGNKSLPFKIGVIKEDKKSWFERHPKTTKFLSLFIPFMFVGVGTASMFGDFDHDNKDPMDYTHRDIQENTLQASGDPIITVDDEPGDAEYTNIQEAINHAHPGDVIKVYGGIYSPDNPIVVNKTLTLEGVEDLKDNEPIPIIKGVPDGGIIVKKESTIDGFEITKCGMSGKSPNGGIVLYSDHNHIKNNILKENSWGIYILGGSNEISQNKITDNGIGIEINSRYNLIHDNYIEKSWYGILALGDNNIIKHNNIIDNEKGIFIYAPENKITKNNFKRNTLHAGFDYSLFAGIYRSEWNRNYWDDWDIRSPRPIYGGIMLMNRKLYPWVNFDWHPSNNPN